MEEKEVRYPQREVKRSAEARVLGAYVMALRRVLGAYVIAELSAWARARALR